MGQTDFRSSEQNSISVATAAILAKKFFFFLEVTRLLHRQNKNFFAQTISVSRRKRALL
jgi:hypothetical protein